MACRRMYSSSAEYQTINDALFYTPERPVTFRGNELTIFDNVNTSEKRYTPWELKETTFKNVMGYCGTLVVDHMIPLGVITQCVQAAWCFNYIWQCSRLLMSSVRRVDLHKDGKHVTLHPRIGTAFTVKISDIEKQEHENTLVETHEEAFLFPIKVAGKGIYRLHGNGQESIKQGELFRAVINGQSIKL